LNKTIQSKRALKSIFSCHC